MIDCIFLLDPEEKIAFRRRMFYFFGLYFEMIRPCAITRLAGKEAGIFQICDTDECNTALAQYASAAFTIAIPFAVMKILIDN